MKAKKRWFRVLLTVTLCLLTLTVQRQVIGGLGGFFGDQAKQPIVRTIPASESSSMCLRFS